MTYLTAEQVLFLHARLIEETGGSHGLRDLNLPLSALGRPQASFGGSDLDPDLHTQAAALMDSLIRNHPFVDGNKRTGIAAAILFIKQNGYQFNVSNEELESFTLEVALSQQNLEDSAIWLRDRSCRVENTK